MRSILVTSVVLASAAAWSCSTPPHGFEIESSDSGSSGTKPRGGAPEAGAPSSGNAGGGGGGAGIDAGTEDAGAPPSSDVDASGDGSTGCAIASAGAIAFIPASTMAPGTACITCHVASGAKKLNFAGTVYTAPHEADLCLGVASGIRVVITDAQGTDHSLDVDSSGNFYDDSLLGFSAPYKAKVLGPAGSAEMIGAQTNGDCNACHTSAGAEGAAGRILGP